MAWFSASSATPQWKMFIISMEQQKTRLNLPLQKISYQSTQPISIINLNLFLPKVTMILNQIKSYNNQLTNFIRIHLPLLVKQSLRIILQIPNQCESAQIKNRYPLQGLQFIQGLMHLPNIFNINYLNEDFYGFYCQWLFYYIKKNFQTINKFKFNNECYQHSLYKNYFCRLFEIPYTVVQCETRIGANYASMTTSITQSINSSIKIHKKQSFLQILIKYLDENPSFLNLLIQNIENESLINCLNKILMANGLYNYPYHLKQHILSKCFQIKTKYISLLTNPSTMNNSIDIHTDLQHKILSIIQLQFNIINRSANIYDGIKLFEYIGNGQNIKNIIFMYSANTHLKINSMIVPSFIEEHLSQLLLAILHKDTSLYKNSSTTNSNNILEIKPKINLAEINTAMHQLILTLKQLLLNKQIKPQLKHLNLIKALYIMILNRQKYQILQNLIVKHDIFTILVEICRKYHYMDILVNSIMDIFKSIFKPEVNLVQYPYINDINFLQIKNKNDIIQEKLTIEAFKAADIIMSTIKAMKSYKDSLFGQFFKFAKVVKQFAKSFSSTLDQSISSDMSMSMGSSLQIQSSASLNLVLQPMFQNQYIKAKSKQWLDFYKITFSQLQINFLRELGKFQEFQTAPQPPETQYKVTKIGVPKQLTNSQVIHDKAEFESTMKNSIQLLHLDNSNKPIQMGQVSVQKNQSILNFKKQKVSDNISKKVQKTDNNKKLEQQKHEQLQITNLPIKIQFKNKKLSSKVEPQSESNQQTTIENGENSFKKFMQSKMNEINTQNKQNKIKKSKTPTKFRSSDNRSSSKIKKWGTNQPEQQNSSRTQTLKQQLLEQTKRTVSTQNKSQTLKKILLKAKLQPLKLIKVGKKLPKVYKQRLIQASGRDSTLFQWLKMAKQAKIIN